MEHGRIILISGPPGSGKSSVSRILAETSTRERALNMHTDDYYQYVRKGYILPWLPEAHEQNTVLIEAFAASAARLASGGYDTIVDGVIGLCFLDIWLNIAKTGLDVRYAILRPDEQTTVSRAAARREEGALTDPDIVKYMWSGFRDLGLYELHAIDTSGQSIEESAKQINILLEKGFLRLK